jgi:hypothetical protein
LSVNKTALEVSLALRKEGIKPKPKEVVPLFAWLNETRLYIIHFLACAFLRAHLLVNTIIVTQRGDNFG